MTFHLPFFDDSIYLFVSLFFIRVVIFGVSLFKWWMIIARLLVPDIPIYSYPKKKLHKMKPFVL